MSFWALAGLDQVVISKRLAERMFGTEFKAYPALIGRQIVLHGNEGPDLLDLRRLRRYAKKTELGL